MEFRIADTFTDRLARLTGEPHKAVNTTAFDLPLNPAQPGMPWHQLDQARDPHCWSVRVSRDMRLIVHKTDASLLLCDVDHHDEAYRWAEHRTLETHPKTGAAPLVEVREMVQDIIVPPDVTAAQPAPPIGARPRVRRRRAVPGRDAGQRLRSPQGVVEPLRADRRHGGTRAVPGWKAGGRL
jgi:hypothetical protein